MENDDWMEFDPPEREDDEIERDAMSSASSPEEEMRLRGTGPIDPEALVDSIMDEEWETPSLKNVGNPVNAAVARKILQHQAESLRTEESFYDLHYFTDPKLWRAIVRFRDGKLTGDAQCTLAKMKHNAHRTMLDVNGELLVITFVVVG